MSDKMTTNEALDQRALGGITYRYMYRPEGSKITVESQGMEKSAAMNEAETVSLALPGKWVSVWRMVSGTRDTVVVKFKDGDMYPVQFSV